MNSCVNTYICIDVYIYNPIRINDILLVQDTSIRSPQLTVCVRAADGVSVHPRVQVLLREDVHRAPSLGPPGAAAHGSGHRQVGPLVRRADVRRQRR